MVSEGFNSSIVKWWILIFHEETNVFGEILHRKRDNSMSNECYNIAYNNISVPKSVAAMEFINKH